MPLFIGVSVDDGGQPRHVMMEYIPNRCVHPCTHARVNPHAHLLPRALFTLGARCCSVRSLVALRSKQPREADSARKQPMTVYEVLNVALDVARAIQFLHRCRPPVVHGGITR